MPPLLQLFSFQQQQQQNVDYCQRVYARRTYIYYFQTAPPSTCIRNRGGDLREGYTPAKRLSKKTDPSLSVCVLHIDWRRR